MNGNGQEPKGVRAIFDRVTIFIPGDVGPTGNGPWGTERKVITLADEGVLSIDCNIQEKSVMVVYTDGSCIGYYNLPFIPESHIPLIEEPGPLVVFR